MQRGSSLDQVLAKVRADLSRYRQRQVLPRPHEKIGNAPRRRCRRRVPGGDGNAIPEQRLFLRTPLAFELIRAGVACRASEIEVRESVDARPSDRFPIEEHVRTE